MKRLLISTLLGFIAAGNVQAALISAIKERQTEIAWGAAGATLACLPLLSKEVREGLGSPCLTNAYGMSYVNRERVYLERDPLGHTRGYITTSLLRKIFLAGWAWATASSLLMVVDMKLNVFKCDPTIHFYWALGATSAGILAWQACTYLRETRTIGVDYETLATARRKEAYHKGIDQSDTHPSFNPNA